MVGQLVRPGRLMAHLAIRRPGRLDDPTMRAGAQLKKGCGGPRDGRVASLARVLGGALRHRVHETTRYLDHAGRSPTEGAEQSA